MEPAEPETPNGDVVSYLGHMRSIHFSLIILVSALLYLVITNWNSSTLLLEELQSLIRIDTNLSDAALRSTPSNLIHVIRQDLDPLNAKLGRQISACLGRGIGIEENTYEFDYVRTQPSLAPLASSNTALYQIRGNFESATWYILAVGDVSDFRAADVDKVKAWMASHSPADGYMGFAFTFSIPPDQQLSATIAEGKVRLLAKVPINTPELISPINKQASKTFRIVPPKLLNEEGPSITAKFHLIEIPCNLRSDWFARTFSALNESWSSVEPLCIADATRWASEQRVATLKGRSLDVLGLQIKAEHVGVIGPIVVVLLLIYLGVYLRELVNAKAKKPKLMPWVCMMKGIPFDVANVLTFLVFPIVVVVLLSLQLLGSPKVALFYMIITLLIGCWILNQIRKVKN